MSKLQVTPAKKDPHAKQNTKGSGAMRLSTCIVLSKVLYRVLIKGKSLPPGLDDKYISDEAYRRLDKQIRKLEELAK